VWFRDAEAVGRLGEFEALAITSAIAALPRLQPQEFLAINVAPGTALGPVLAQTLADVPVDRLVLEITEHAAVDDYAQLFQALYPLRARGLRLAIDDVGAGYSTMAHVLNLAPEIIKLDRSFTAGIGTHRQRRSLVQSIRAFAGDTDSALLAEGIETVEELETMRSLGVTLGQGYLLGHPKPIVDTTDHLGMARTADAVNARHGTPTT
jgi:EAL domain-containing protein (putative c-di-GMP-specific phosphodiesterase class I)